MNTLKRADRVAFHFDSFLLQHGWSQNVRIICQDGEVEEVFVGVPAEPSDIRLGIGLPGMHNVHSHAFQRGMAGLAEVRGSNYDSFWTWREVMYRFVGKLTPSQLTDIAALAYIEMLESGFTRVGEFHYLHHDRFGRAFANPAEMSSGIVEAAGKSGIGLTHLPVFYAHSAFGGKSPETHQRRFIHSLDSFSRLFEEVERVVRTLPDAVVGLAPHSLRAVTPEELSVLIRLAGDRPIHIHIAEQPKEVVSCLEWSGARPVEWLLHHAPVGPNWCLVHATHMTDVETATMAASGAIAGLCPITEANLGDGIFPARKFIEHLGSYGIGSDSNVLIDMTEELRLLEYSQRLGERSRNVFAAGSGRSTGLDLYQTALEGGRQAMGVSFTLTPGTSADFITLDTRHPTLLSRRADRMLDGLIFGAGRKAIDGVWRRGKQVVFSGQHHDRERIVQQYEKSLSALLA